MVVPSRRMEVGKSVRSLLVLCFVATRLFQILGLAEENYGLRPLGPIESGLVSGQLFIPRAPSFGGTTSTGQRSFNRSTTASANLCASAGSAPSENPTAI